MTNIVKKLIPAKIKQLIHTFLNSENISLPKRPRIFIFLAADYGNIGDLAISSAQKKFIEQNLNSHEVFSVPISKTRLWMESIKRQINEDDMITIIGGGNMGSLYSDIEELRQLVIKSFPLNKIICFPQTLDWDNSVKSYRAIKKIQKIYSNHANIHVFARESITFHKLKEVFFDKKNINISFVPDIVMSTTAKKLGVTDVLNTNAILMCLREDKERGLNIDHLCLLEQAIQETGYNFTRTDTHVGGSNLSEEVSQKLLTDKIQQFTQARLVITDRLHGMILCILSGTPCLVLPNSNHKIKQTYLDWLQYHPRVVFLELENFEDVSHYINHLLSIPCGNLTESPVELAQYKPLIEALLEK